MPSPAQTDRSNRLHLPAAPESLTGPVKAWREPVALQTYLPEDPNPHPMFLDRRVYQGSSGRVYPMPSIDRIATEPVLRLWDAIHIENEYVRLMVLPEIGGRIHVGYDKLGDYDFFYRQNVIKPALVGLAGPWISGGVEFNWPQHHRPATFMPVETTIEEAADGSMTVWCSDHDPMLRMKGMHGICLHPGRAIVELKVRLYNRTPLTQTFLWWANVATRVHEQYQSFFPEDVRFVADHAKRAVASFPLSDRPYYGIDYPARAEHGVPLTEEPPCFQPDGSYAANDLSWYANIPVPTSYMVTRTEQDFFGGYDHRADAGVVHVANHHVAPGKKQWTWGNHEFGYAWDRNLTDEDGPYIELMAGVYTDNQPDFSYLAPWETKTFTQTWYPLRSTGVPQAANLDAALHLITSGERVELAIAVTRSITDAVVEIVQDGVIIESLRRNLEPANTLRHSSALNAASAAASISCIVRAEGRVVIAYDRAAIQPAEAPVVAREPLPPQEIASADELYLTGAHLQQYRHATRRPELYWQEALRRDPGDCRCLNALGLWHYRRGELTAAADHFQSAITRCTLLNPNPPDGEPFYHLGLALRALGEQKRAYDAFYKATWNAAWRGPAYYALAEIDACRQQWSVAREHLERTLRAEADHLHARTLLVYVLGRLGEPGRAAVLLRETRVLDPLDIGARWLEGEIPVDGQQQLDLAFDLLRSGRVDEASDLLSHANLLARDGSAPMLLLTLADIQAKLDPAAEAITRETLRGISKALCFPNRLEEMQLLERATQRDPNDPLAFHLLGTLYYDRGRYEEAIACWEQAVQRDPLNATTWRNLGIAYFNVRKDVDAAVNAYDRAVIAAPQDARILFEMDQLWKRTCREPGQRLQALLRHRDLVETRDDLAVELATLFNQANQPQQALDLLLGRRFQPWEGGEGLVLGQYVRACLLLGQKTLQEGDPSAALTHVRAALAPPESLSEARHLLANQSDVYYWMGRAYEALGRKDEARAWYERATRQKGDFQQMSVRTISAMTYWTARALDRLGRGAAAAELFHQIAAYATQLAQAQPAIDYFATSLPTMLLFHDDLKRSNEIEAMFLHAQAAFGLGTQAEAERLLRAVLAQDANHMAAQDLLADVLAQVSA
jgi:tetratricopeptide (TPR) repeat protein